MWRILGRHHPACHMPYALGVNLCSWIQDTPNLLDSDLTLPLLRQKCGRWNWHCQEGCYKYQYHYIVIALSIIIAITLFLFKIFNLNHDIIMIYHETWCKMMVRCEHWQREGPCHCEKIRHQPCCRDPSGQWPGPARRIPAHLNACLQGLTGCMVVGRAWWFLYFLII